MPNEATDSATTVRRAIAAEVRAEIARQQKSQREIADVLNMQQSSLQLRVTGQRPFRAEELVALAEVLGVPVEQFLRPPALSQAAVA